MILSKNIPIVNNKIIIVLFRNDITEQENLVAELVHQFVLPEVEKKISRNRIIKQQQNMLKSIHAELFDTLESLPTSKHQGNIWTSNFNHYVIIVCIYSERID